MKTANNRQHNIPDLRASHPTIISIYQLTAQCVCVRAYVRNTNENWEPSNKKMRPVEILHCVCRDYGEINSVK